MFEDETASVSFGNWGGFVLGFFFFFFFFFFFVFFVFGPCRAELYPKQEAGERRRQGVQRGCMFE
ncbi:hypothetical protein DUD43_06920 [Alcaligenes faecalis]|nr:hypothetical protein DUD43_06920 [Alcaligenes faecalis]